MISVCFLVYKSLGLNEYSYFLLVSFQMCIMLASDFVPFPGGIVTSEALILGINNMLYGESLAFPAMFTLRTITFYLPVLLSFVYYVIFKSINRKKVIQ